MDVPSVVEEGEVLGAFSPAGVEIRTVPNEFHDLSQAAAQRQASEAGTPAAAATAAGKTAADGEPASRPKDHQPATDHRHHPPPSSSSPPVARAATAVPDDANAARSPGTKAPAGAPDQPPSTTVASLEGSREHEASVPADVSAARPNSSDRLQESPRQILEQGASRIAVTPAPARAVDAGGGCLADNMVSVVMVTNPHASLLKDGGASAPQLPAAPPPATPALVVPAVGVEAEVSEDGPGVVEMMEQNLKMAQNRLAVLQRQAVSPLVLKPTNLNSLERIGVDSQNQVYWYDGGKNLYQSPEVTPPNSFPKESDLVLLCKSMVQWQNKLKQLRSSCTEADSKLAQVIKESVLSRVKIATKRKIRLDVPSPRTIQQHIQIQQPSSQPGTKLAATVVSSSEQQPALAVIQHHNLPPGSIMVVPPSLLSQAATGSSGSSGGHNFPSVPLVPVFANTAVIMPQNLAAPTTTSATPTSLPATSSLSIVAKANGKPEVDVAKDVDGATTKPPPPLLQKVSEKVAAATVVMGDLANDDAPVVPVIKEINPASLLAQGAIANGIQSAPGTKDPMAASSSSKVGVSATPHPQQLSAVPVLGLQHPVGLAATIQQHPTIVMSVDEVVPLGNIDKQTKSMEILEEVPVRLVEVGKEEEGDKGVLLPTASSQDPAVPTTVVSSTATKQASPLERLGDASKATTRLDSPTTVVAPPSEAVPPEGGSAASSAIATTANSSAAPVTAETSLAVTSTSSSSYTRSQSEHHAIVALAQLANGPSTHDDMLLSFLGDGRTSSSSSVKATAVAPEAATKPLTKRTPRKQKPVASARLPLTTSVTTTTAATATSVISQALSLNSVQESSGGNVRKSAIKEKHIAAPRLSAAGKKREFTPQELLRILDIPQSSSQPAVAGGNQTASKAAPDQKAAVTTRGRGHGRGRGRGRGGKGRSDISKATMAKVREVPVHAATAATVPGSRPMKEYIIDTDSESSGSSSESEEDSSSDSDDEEKESASSQSNSESDDSSSSHDEEDNEKAAAAPEQVDHVGRAGRSRGRGRVRGGRGRGRATGRRGRLQPSTTSRQSRKSSLRDGMEEIKRKGAAASSRRGRGRGSRVQSLGVSIPRSILLGHFKSRGNSLGQKRKSSELSSRPKSNDSLETHHNMSPSKLLALSLGGDQYSKRPPSKDDLSAEVVNLASYYPAYGNVDLDTLSELTRSVNKSSDDDVPGPSCRSKRTCVRVREEMNRLQEIFGDDPLLAAAGKAGQGGGGRRGRGRGVTGDAYGKKGRRQSLSQVQHVPRRGRKRKKQQPEEEDSDLHPSSSKEPKLSERVRLKYVFSTHLANKAGEAVYRRRYDSILQFHRAQPKTSDFLRLPDAPRRHKRKSESPARQSTESESEPQPPAATRDAASSSSTPAVASVRRSRRIAGSSVTEEPEQEAEPVRGITTATTTRRGHRQAHPPPQSPVKSMEEDSEDNCETEEMHFSSDKERNISQTTEESPRGLSSVGSPGEPVAGVTHQLSADHGAVAVTTEQSNDDLGKPATADNTPCNQLSPGAESPALDQPRSEVNYTICHGTPEMTRKAANGPLHSHPRSIPDAGQQQQQQIISPKSVSSDVPTAAAAESRLPPATHSSSSSAHHDPPPAAWAPAQYPHTLPGGYPTAAMYGRHLAAAYPHGSQAAAASAANYSYLPYPWPHPPHPSANQQGVAPDLPHAYHPQHMHPTVASPPLPWPTAPRQASPTQPGRDLNKQPQLIADGIAHPPGSAPHLPHQPGHSLSFSHHHHPAHDPAYSYGFEPRHPSLAHIWPPTQLPHPQLHPLITAPHLTTPQSLWYPHAHHQGFSHRMAGMDANPSPAPSVTDKIAKARSLGDGGNKSQFLDAKHNSNQSNNNNRGGSQERTVLDSVLLSRVVSSGVSKANSSPRLPKATHANTQNLPPPSTSPAAVATTSSINPPCLVSVALPGRSAPPTAISAILEQARLTNELSGNS